MLRVALNDLKSILLRQINQTGPMSIADYMNQCLLHPKHGYYAKQDPFGNYGDFTTAPEISQMFGELIGLWVAQVWMDQDCPRANLVELGPGRGTLMRDICRATRVVPGFSDAVTIHLLEASPTLRKVQHQTLHDQTINWIDDLDALPDATTYVIANEFFDALPIQQFQRTQRGWREKMVGATQGQLTFGMSAEYPLSRIPNRMADTRPGDVVEICNDAVNIAGRISGLLKDKGAALAIDYGSAKSLGDTFQALHDHKPCDPLDMPGDADLTGHVDFGAVRDAATGLLAMRLTPQGRFLERLGISDRAQKLAHSLTGKAVTSHIAAHRRLTHPDEMGSLFKVLCLYPKGVAQPPGFDP
jgi:NADH dehydrogenase [ubiquinone] 1 alpha subcomplex assembly factor 7